MLIKRYKNGILVTEEIKIDANTRKEVITTKNLPVAIPKITNAPSIPTPPKKGCGCGGRR